ncbi:MAG: class I SAM-dependent methyltransferase [Odoribacter splanchnicus]
MAKKEAVKGIFNDIAPSYDRLNHFLSMNIDKRWRRVAIKRIAEQEKGRLLDVACGTGDFSIAAVRKVHRWWGLTFRKDAGSDAGK